MVPWPVAAMLAHVVPVGLLQTQKSMEIPETEDTMQQLASVLQVSSGGVPLAYSSHEQMPFPSA